MKPEFIGYIKEWLLKADQDLVAANELLKIEPLLSEIICFHCQQAIEKNLKGFLCYHRIDIEKTHDISFLLIECSNIDSIFSTVDPMDISEFAVKGRYPGVKLVPNAAETKAYYQLAIQVSNLVKERIIFT